MSELTTYRINITSDLYDQVIKRSHAYEMWWSSRGIELLLNEKGWNNGKWIYSYTVLTTYNMMTLFLLVSQTLGDDI